MTPRVLGSFTVLFGPTSYERSNTGPPLAVTVSRTAWRSWGTTTWLETPGTSSVGFVVEHPEPLAVTTETAASAANANASARHLPIDILTFRSGARGSPS